jgi:hypothetical protein
MSILYDEKSTKRMAMPRMIRNELLEDCKAVKETAPGKAVSTLANPKPVKKLTKKEQAKVDAKKASSAAIAKLLVKEPTVPKVREFLENRIKELCED